MNLSESDTQSQMWNEVKETLVQKTVATGYIFLNVSYSLEIETC